MEVLKSHITIGEFSFDFVHSVEYVSSWDEQTSRGNIKLPSKLKFDRGNLKTQIKKGTPVKIETGYLHNFQTVFNGYVTRVIPSVPVEIMFEDEMYQLKRIEVNTVAKNEPLKSFLNRVIPGYDIDCFDMTLPKFIASKITAAQLLSQFKEDYGFSVFFRGKKLIVGKQYDPQNYIVHKIKLNFNSFEDSLEYISKDDLKLKVVGISNMENGQKHEVEIGDPDGQTRTLNFYNISKSDLKAVVTKEAEKLMFDGYRGSISIFGSPYVRHGDLVELMSDEETDKTGRYWVDEVNYQFGVNGIVQVLKLGERYNG